MMVYEGHLMATYKGGFAEVVDIGFQILVGVMTLILSMV
jgi:hypothetical protein